MLYQRLAKALPQNGAAAAESPSGLCETPAAASGEGDLDACSSLQVESLIENEAEKDYLYDVLRMYHQWVASVLPPLFSLLFPHVCVIVVPWLGWERCFLHLYQLRLHFYIRAGWWLTPSSFCAPSRILIACRLNELMNEWVVGGACFNESFYVPAKPLISFHCAPTSLASYLQKPFFVFTLQTELNWLRWIIQSGGPMVRFNTIAVAALQ